MAEHPSSENGLPAGSGGSPWALFAGAAALLGLAWAIGATAFDGFDPGLGNIQLPPPRALSVYAVQGFFGTAAALLLAAGLARTLPWSARLTSAIDRLASPDSDRPWLLAMTFAAFAVPALLRTWVLGGAPLTDDEAAYRFGAELLAQGHLSVASHPMKLFFDNVYLVNDGRLYPQYPLGWPALMVPFLWAKDPAIANWFNAAATVPALFFSARRLLGSAWGKVPVALFVLSPMLMTSAATGLSHAACLMALSWVLWFSLRGRDAEAPKWMPAALAFFFCLAVFIRPTSGLMLGGPMLAAWLWEGLKPPSRAQLARALLTFAVPAAVGAALFLLVNDLQTGQPLKLAYQRSLEYAAENGYRFSAWPSAEAVEHGLFGLHHWKQWPFTVAVALLRLNADLFGWPCSLLFVLVAALGRRLGFLWVALAVTVAFHGLASDVGVDTFGPVHFLEAALPLLLLTAEGLRVASAWLAGPGTSTPSRAGLPMFGAVALFVVAAVLYDAPRVRSLHRLAAHIERPWKAVEQANPGPSLIFTAHPFVPACHGFPTRHFVFFRPNNDPGLTNEQLWANHLGADQDRRLLAQFPGRKGFILAWTEKCEVSLVPLDAPEADRVPARVPGAGRGGESR